MLMMFERRWKVEEVEGVAVLVSAALDNVISLAIRRRNACNAAPGAPMIAYMDPHQCTNNDVPKEIHFHDSASISIRNV